MATRYGIALTSSWALWPQPCSDSKLLVHLGDRGPLSGEEQDHHGPQSRVRSDCRLSSELALTLVRLLPHQVTGAYIAAIENLYTPSVLALSRQNLPNLEGSSVEKTLMGAYVLSGEQHTTVSKTTP